MNLLIEAQSVSAEEVAKAAKKLWPIRQDVGEFVTILPEDLRKVWALISRTEEEFKTQQQELVRNAIQVVCGEKNAKKAAQDSLAKYRRIAKKLSGQSDVFWAEAHARVSVNETTYLVLLEGWAVHYMYPACVQCNERHPVADDLPMVTMEVVLLN